MGEAKRRRAAAAKGFTSTPSEEHRRPREGLSILNVGAGDTKITFDKSKPEEVERARRVVKDMLRRGFAILVQAGEKDGKPIYYRATDFDPLTDEYIVAGVPDEVVEEPAPSDTYGPLREQPKKDVLEQIKDLKKGNNTGKGRMQRRVKADGTPAVAVSRSAGGMSRQANSVEMQNMRSFDKLAGLRAAFTAIAAEKHEWAGIPMLLAGHPLVVEPKFPRAAEMMAFRFDGEKPKKPLEERGYTLRNRFFSSARRSDILIFEKDGGGIEWGLDPAVHSLTQQLTTLGASRAWGIEQEAKAVQLLATLLSHHAFKSYMLTGAFLETSSRSRCSYIFRRLRPTVAMVPSGGEEDPMRILAALCMHPIAYYEGSWAGAMCPTDDVIAHLMLMRGDEAMFWRRANQHPAWRPEAGL